MTAAPIEYRPLEDLADLAAAVDVVHAVWGGDAGLLHVGLLRAAAHAGNPVLGAFDPDLGLCGMSIAFLGAAGGEVHLHSHITGVLESHQHLGVGFGLKVAQRDWCLANGVDLVTWTFDPMIARNAYFNLHKLGATAPVFLPDFYGAMDDDTNRGEPTDRLEAHWRVRSPRVEQVMAGASVERPAAIRTVALPADHVRLRRDDPDEAARWRARVAEQLAEAMDEGLEAVDFKPGSGYVLAPRA